jgi:hypothetical protein
LNISIQKLKSQLIRVKPSLLRRREIKYKKPEKEVLQLIPKIKTKSKKCENEKLFFTSLRNTQN